MVQSILFSGIGAKGIVSTLIVAGIILPVFNIAPDIANIAINGGVSIGLVLGLLGVLGVAKRMGLI